MAKHYEEMKLKEHVQDQGFREKEKQKIIVAEKRAKADAACLDMLDKYLEAEQLGRDNAPMLRRFAEMAFMMQDVIGNLTSLTDMMSMLDHTLGFVNDSLSYIDGVFSSAFSTGKVGSRLKSKRSARRFLSRVKRMMLSITDKMKIIPAITDSLVIQMGKIYKSMDASMSRQQERRAKVAAERGASPMKTSFEAALEARRQKKFPDATGATGATPPAAAPTTGSAGEFTIDDIIGDDSTV